MKIHTSMELVSKSGRSPLHNAISYSSIHTVCEVAKSGLSINIQDGNKRTPLHYAVEQNNREAVCVLLYYGADVNILCSRKFSPFTYALYLNRLDIAQVLFPYQDDLSLRNIYGYSVLHLAAWRKSPIAIDLVKTGVDVNCITDYGDSPLVFSVEYNDADLFKLIWSRCDHQTLLSSEKPFLLTHIQTWRFSVSEWLECINLILDSSAAFELIDHCKGYLDENTREFGFFSELLHSFYETGVKTSDRIIIINKCLTLGATVNIFDLNLTVDLFGFTEELETLVYNFDWSLGTCYSIFPVPICICGVEIVNSEMMTAMLKKQIFLYCDSSKPTHLQKGIINSLGFFSLSLHQKQEIVASCQLYLKDYNDICEKLDVIPVIPSLLELSRNKAREIIQQTFKVNKPYQFYDGVKMMNLPEPVKQIIKFKRSIY